jgi:hypothetical protein
VRKDAHRGLQDTRGLEEYFLLDSLCRLARGCERQEADSSLIDKSNYIMKIIFKTVYAILVYLP